MKVLYTVKKDSISRELVDDNYQVKDNEYLLNEWLKKPRLINGSIVESITQEEIDERDALILAQQNEKDVLTQLDNAKKLAIKIFVFVRKDNVGLTNVQKGILMGFAKLLMQGDIEQAKTDFNAITRPAQENKMQKVYDKLKTEFDNL